MRVLCESSHSPASMEGCSDKGLKGGSTYVAVKYTSGIVSCECCIKDKSLLTILYPLDSVIP